MRRGCSVILFILGGWILSAVGVLGLAPEDEQVSPWAIVAFVFVFAAPFLLIATWVSPGKRLAELGLTMMIAAGVAAFIVLTMAIISFDKSVRRFMPEPMPEFDFSSPAMIGATSEDVAASLKDGSFGMARDTAEFLNGAVQRGAEEKQGFGEAVGRAIDRAKLPHRELSVLWQCLQRGIPGTVHVTLGADIVHMHAGADGAAIGATSLADFRRFAELVTTLQGGAYVNVGSAVTLPEVFLKALAIARNLGATVDRFTTANLDQLPHYRPRMNVLERPKGGESIDLRGHHELLLPLLRWLLVDPPAEWLAPEAAP